MVMTTPMPSCGSPRRWSGQRRRRNGYRKDASRWAAKCPPANPKVDEPKVDEPLPTVDEPNCTDVELKAVDANVSSVTVTEMPLQPGTAHCKDVVVRTQISRPAAVVSPSCSGVEECTHDQAPLKAEQSLSSVKLPIEAAQNPPNIDLAETGARRSVRIDDATPIIHEIAPYAEVYGLHPREFVFDRRYFMVPANRLNEMGAACNTETSDEEDSDSDVEDSRNEWCFQYSI